MGEIYAAEDTKLHRTVALKVLPEIFATDPARRQRFEREAQAVAALNHPNIVTIHSVEETNGIPFLTMELVDGRALSDMIPPGGMPAARLIPIAIAIADALSAAQQRGITHRDLKPANVMVTVDGRVKVLDFGLAHVHEAELAAAGDDLTRLGGADLTGEGKIIGTVAYMSPEQAEGKPVDPRSDIFSLGVMLHEMATGDRPFKGDTNVSIISSILKDTPGSITDTNPAIPADLARIVRRCLAKEPSRRFQTAADVRAELEDLADEISHPSGIASRPQPQRHRRTGMMAAAAVLLVALGAAAVWLIARERGSARPPADEVFTIDRITQLTTTGTANVAALSPDGRYVTHVKADDAGQSLWIRQTATTSDVRIMPPAAVRYDGLTFSPDGNFVYYVTYGASGSGIARLYRIPALGGTPEMVLEDIDSAVAFSPDGKRIAFARGDPAKGKGAVIVANVDGTAPRVLTEGETGFTLQNEAPTWSPDGRTILAGARSTTGLASTIVYAVDVNTGTMRRVGEPWLLFRNMQWLPGGRSFLIDGIEEGATHAQIWQEDYPSGTVHRVTNDVNRYIGLSISADGRSVVTVQLTRRANLWSFDPARDTWQRITTGAGADGADGLTVLRDRRIAYVSDAAGESQIFIIDADGTNQKQLTNIDGRAASPSAAPDSRWIAFEVATRSGGGIYRTDADGTGLRALTHGPQDTGPVVSPDGKWVYYTTILNGQLEPMKVLAEGGDPARVGTAAFRVAAVMPDGVTLFGTSWNQARSRSEAATMPAGGGPVTLLDLPVSGLLSPDGRSYFYPDPPFAPTRILKRSMVDGRVTELTRASGEQFFNGAAAPDGKVVVSRGIASTDVVLISAAPAGRRD